MVPAIVVEVDEPPDCRSTCRIGERDAWTFSMISAFLVALMCGLRCRGLAVGWRFFQPVGLEQEISDYLLQVTVLTLELLDLLAGWHRAKCYGSASPSRPP